VAEVYLASVIRQRQQEFVAVDPAVLQAETGLYRSVRDHQALSIDLEDGELHVNHRSVLKPVTGDGFVVGDDGPQAEFARDASGKIVRLHLASQVDEGNYYEKVERWNPTAAELKSMTGEYSSDEAEVTFQVTLEKDHLVIHRRPDATIALTPTYRDGFIASLGSVRFLRDSRGRVTELSIGEQRLWALRFQRVR
jgi:hypothetical protein